MLRSVCCFTLLQHVSVSLPAVSPFPLHHTAETPAKLSPHKQKPALRSVTFTWCLTDDTGCMWTAC